MASGGESVVNQYFMTAFVSFVRSTLGLKVMMALSGFVLFGFCVEHMVGMMLFFKGPGTLNGYGSLLRYSPVMLWTARTAILLSATVHIWTATVLVLRQWAARPVGYRRKQWRTSSYAARTMKYSGPLVLAFVFFHLAHFTWGWKVTPARFVEGDVYANIDLSFRYGWVTLVYVLGVSLVGLHLLHGGYSMFESLGIKHARVDGILRTVAGAATVLVVAGFILLPCAILFRLVGG
jgi:succinate dehydrogenase / fumarate reductase cytochrome b subunit